MEFTLEQLTKDLDKVDLEDILSDWLWLLKGIKGVALITVLGDIFFVGDDDRVYRLQTDMGEITKVAKDIEEFDELLQDEELIDEWFLPELVSELITNGKTLKENQVYRYIQQPIIGGEYTIDNIEPADMSVYFALSGQICEQVKDLPEGAVVNIKIENPGEKK